MTGADERGIGILGSEIQQDDIGMMNSSLISDNSQRSQAYKSQSQARPRRGQGRILQNNVSEVASYLADGMQWENRSKNSYSRYEITSYGRNKDYFDKARE